MQNKRVSYGDMEKVMWYIFRSVLDTITGIQRDRETERERQR